MSIKGECVETSRTVLHNGNNHSNNNKRRTVSMYLSSAMPHNARHSNVLSHLMIPVFLWGLPTSGLQAGKQRHGELE